MPYADIEVRKQKNREYSSRPEVKARRAELYRKRYSRDQNGLRTNKRKDHYDRWSNPEYKEQKKQQYCKRWDNDWEGQKLIQIRSKCKKFNIEFDIDREDIKLPDMCPIFHTPFDLTRKDRNNAPSVDRIDNSKGYIKGNVIVVSNKANAMKREATLQDMKRLVEFYENLVEEYDNE